ncbi:MAG TPA: asparagine--tRNA ligase [Chloroflexi bacterium]|nr:asparagine--tRNA ligase [Chloroflexota bacterium]
MPEVIRIQDIARHAGEQVAIQGWLYNRTDKGKLQFLLVRDGTGFAQCVVFEKDVSPEVFEAANELTQESSLVISGVVRQDDRAPGVPGGYEIGVTDLDVLQIAEEYPIQLKEHGVDFLMDNRHLWVRSQSQWAVLRVRATVVRAIRDWLDEHDFVNMDTPIITPAACEGTSTLFETDYFGEPAYLAQSGQLYNEANIYAFGRVYCFGPTFRAEKSKTRRHLTEFWMVEPEMTFCDLDQYMEIGEQFVSYIVQTCLKERAQELELLGRDVSHLEKVAPPFPRVSYDDALEMLAEIREETEDEALRQSLAIEWGDDFGSPHETELTKRFEKPVFVYGYPTMAKAFYMEPWPGRPEVSKSADLLAPEGYGEIIGGSERISNPDLLLQRLREWNLPREAFEWYIDLRKYGSVPHSGFGLGVERTVTWICGLDHLRETISFPRMLKRVYP